MNNNTNNRSDAGGEFFRHRERADGNRELLFGPLGQADHGHAVLDRSGRVKFLREVDGRVIADDRDDR
jgi:hypothetical protein